MKYIVTFKLMDSTELHCILVDLECCDSYIVNRAATLCKNLAERGLLVGEKFNIDKRTETTIKLWDSDSKRTNNSGKMKYFTVNAFDNLGKRVTLGIEATGVKSAYNKALQKVKGTVFYSNDPYIHMIIYDNSQIPKRNSAKRMAEAILRNGNLGQARVVTSKARDTLDKMKEYGVEGVEALENIQILTKMIDNRFVGDYKQLSKSKAIEYLGALIFFSRPDIVEPDFCDMQGQQDTISIMAMELKRAKSDLEQYIHFINSPQWAEKIRNSGNIYDVIYTRKGDLR